MVVMVAMFINMSQTFDPVCPLQQRSPTESLPGKVWKHDDDDNDDDDYGDDDDCGDDYDDDNNHTWKQAGSVFLPIKTSKKNNNKKRPRNLFF